MSNLNIIIETKALAHAVSFANSVVEKRNVIAELSNIKLSAKDGILELITTNMEIYLSQKINVQMIKEGEITVSTKTLNDIIRKMPDNEISLIVSDDTNQLELLGQNCTFNLLTLPVSQFPKLDEMEAEATIGIACRDLARMIDSTLFSVSLDETRYNLNGVYFHVENNKCLMASTDGHRLSVSEILTTTNSQKFGVILPKKTLEELSKILKDPKNIHEDLNIYLSVNKIKFVCNNIVMVSKLIDGTFPDYQDFIPTSNQYKLTISTKLLSEAIDRIATITVDKFQAIKLSLSKAMLEITASGESRGVGMERIASCYDDGNSSCIFDHDETISIGFNPKYITEACNALYNSTKTSQIELYFADPSSPALIKARDNSREIYVIMPVKV